jgi:hypothetical protein
LIDITDAARAILKRSAIQNGIMNGSRKLG